MEALGIFGIYCLKTSLILITFSGIYYFCLRKETFYRFNRFFLLTGLVIALLLPFIPIRYTVEINMPDIPVTLITESEYTLSTAENNTVGDSLSPLLCKWLPVIYLTGIFFSLITRLTGLSHSLRLTRKNKYQKLSRYNMIESADFKGAFSFFRFIFIPEHLNETEKKVILKHEEAHIIQNHWADLLFLNLLNILWWFNPVIWLYGKMIRNNHEYLADQAVLANCEQISYQKVLVNQWFKTPVFPIINSFSYSNRLKRIRMMKKNSSNPAKNRLSLLILPALATFLWAFAEPEYIYAEKSTDDIFIRKNPVFTATDKLEMISNDVQPADAESIANQTETALLPQNELTVKSNDSSKTLPKKEVTPIEKQDAIHSAKATATINGTESAPMIIIDGTTTTTSPKNDDTTVVNHDKTDQIRLRDLKIKENPLIIIDGERYDEGLENIKPEDISSISVLKDKSAAELYGEDGKNGVILITTDKERRKQMESSGYEIRGIVVDKSGKPLKNATVTTGYKEKVITGEQGTFTLHIIPDDWLIISAEGFSTLKIETDKNKLKTFFNIQLKKVKQNESN